MKEWVILSDKEKGKLTKEQIVKTLLRNRGLKGKEEIFDFFNPKDPKKISLAEVGLKKDQVERAIERLKKAKERKEKIIVYGDYDADGVSATAILWETLYKLSFNVLPYIPDRFSEGYGINQKSVKALKEKNPGLSLIITVDNGIVAEGAISFAKNLGIETIVCDHHADDHSLKSALAVVHTTKVGGAAAAWFLAREVAKAFGKKKIAGLDLVALGTVADQIPLLGANRAFVKYGLAEIEKESRVGLRQLAREAGIAGKRLTTYDLGFIMAPRINAMGRISHAMDSLRLLCTRSEIRARNLAILLSKTNQERQTILDETLLLAKERVTASGNSPIVVYHEEFHEGVIGLTAGRLVEEFYRPVVVIARREKISKASARSIPGFNIVEQIMKLKEVIIEGGGHPMAAGFSLETARLDEFVEKFMALSKDSLTEALLQRKLKADLALDFSNLNDALFKKLSKFAPHGLGNPTPLFVTRGVAVSSARTVGRDASHLKLTLEKEGVTFVAIAFNLGFLSSKVKPGVRLDLLYSLNENTWNGKTSLELFVRDMNFGDDQTK